MSTEAKKSYKKRVIQPVSSDEEEDEEVPIVKKSKPEPTAINPSTTAPTSNSKKPNSTTTPFIRTPILPNPNGPPAPSPKVTEVEKPKAKLNVFTTGGSEASSEHSEKGMDSDSDDEPLAKTKAVVSKKDEKKVNGDSKSNGNKATNGNVNGVTTNGKGKRGKESSSEDDEPLSKSSKKVVAPASKKAKTVAVPEKKVEEKSKKPVSKSKKDSVPVKATKADDSSEDDKPLAARSKSTKSTTAAPSSSSAKPKSKNAKASTSSKKAATTDEESEEEKDSSADDSDVPLAKSKSKAKSTTAPASTSTKSKAKPAANIKSDSESPKKPVVAKGKGKAKKESVADDDEAKSEDGEDMHRWWDEENDGDTKWKTLEHNGIIFPPEYEAHGVKMNYAGKPVTLSPEAEEVASFYAAILETDYPKNPVFVKNFFTSFLEVLAKHPPLDGTKIKEYEKCDFRPIFEYLDAEKIKKKLMTGSEKKAIKTARDILEEPYKFCILDGRKEKVGNFRVEPPGLFRGRGEHPKTGLLKTRVEAEQITLNIGKGVKVPPAPPGHQWKDVLHDDKVTWLATWKENINGSVKYVFLAAGSSLKGQSDLKKFEKARALKEHIDRIRKDYTTDLKDKETSVRQRATAIYLIDRFALRNGNEKSEEEADTVGCCSLRYEHVTLTPPRTVTFDFLGKDSIRYVNEVQVDDQVFKNLKIFKKEPKAVGDLLFDRLGTSMVNKYLTGYMEGLTAKVFRTYNASWTFVQQLKNTPKDASVADKILAYNRANRLVAVLCNHQRSVSKGHGVLMDKMADKILALKYQRKKFRCALHAFAGKNSKKYKEYEEDESDLDDDWITKHEIELVVLEKEKIRKKFEKENKKLEETGEKAMKDSVLKERLEAADVLEATLKEEKRKAWRVSKIPEDKVLAAIKKMDERIVIAKTAAVDRDEGKEISLGTSKINYLDPRITVHWALKHDVPLSKLLSKTLLEKFVWAVEGIKKDPDFDW